MEVGILEKSFKVGDIVEHSAGPICNGMYGVIEIGPYGELCVLDNEGAPDMDVRGNEKDLNIVGNKWDNPELLSVFNGYQPEMRTVKKDLIYAAITSVSAGIKHAKENLSKYDKAIEELTYKDETWVKKIEEDIRQMESTLDLLRK